MKGRKGSPVRMVDVLVVGAGPAGSRAAEVAAEGGASVLLVEKRKNVGVPVQCAEFLHRTVVRKLEVPSRAIAQDVDGMVTHLFGGVKAISRAPGCVLHRDLFDAFLSERAVKAGAELMTDTLAVEPIMGEKRGDGAVGAVLEHGRTGKLEKVWAKVIIGADGPSSVVGSWIDQENVEALVAHQRTVKLTAPLKFTEVYLHPDYPGGYGWLFPKGKYANVGVGVERSLGGSPGSALRDLVTSLGDRIGPMVSKTAGHIPVGGPLKSVVGSVMLVGDAGGFTHPITGGGIQQAVETGALAGDAAARFISGEEGALEGYASEWMSILGPSLGHALDRRRHMVLSWRKASENKDAFEALMRKSWIAFKEYRSI
jgi:digeranylgeranylglycerophospholipid reductase